MNPAIPAARFTIYDNDVQGLGYGGGEGIPLQLLDQLSDVVVVHNTFANALKKAVSLDGPAPMSRMVIAANVLPNGTYGVQGTSTGVGLPSIAKWLPDVLFTDNELIGASCKLYPATTLCPAALLVPAPNAGDGRAIGADVAKVNAAIAGAVVAP